jgi:hypothetical protein
MLKEGAPAPQVASAVVLHGSVTISFEVALSLLLILATAPASQADLKTEEKSLDG